MAFAAPSPLVTAKACIARPLVASERAQWSDFLAASETGTLFQDLRFLSYHEAGLHAFHHLVIHRDGVLIALIPGALAQSKTGVAFHSGAGASFGGFVLDRRCRLASAMEITGALVDHAKAAGWKAIRITLPPSCYNGRIAALPSFALSRHRFALQNRNLSFLLPLQPTRSRGFADYFRDTSANIVRSARRKGVASMRGGMEAFESFVPLYRQTYARHGKPPTHTEAELQNLLVLVPGAIRFYVTLENGGPTGGLCVFMHNKRIASVFYICMSDDQKSGGGVLVAIADAIDDLANSAVEWIDFGPSADHMSSNDGVVRFKEGLGTEYHVREQWVLSLDAPMDA